MHVSPPSPSPPSSFASCDSPHHHWDNFLKKMTQVGDSPCLSIKIDLWNDSKNNCLERKGVLSYKSLDSEDFRTE